MATKQPALVAPSSGEEFQLAADGRTESIATRLKARPARSRSSARERRHERRWIRDALQLVHICQESVRIAYRVDLIA